MKHTTFIKLILSGIALLLFLVSAIVYVIDPYRQYMTFDLPIAYELEMNSFAYCNPGIAKNYEYDTVITGSSMSRSFRPSYVDEVFDCKTVKLSMAEARGKDFADLFLVLENKKGLKRIIMGLDTFAYTVEKDYSSYEKPMFLYDDNLLNDALYLTNMDGLEQCAKTLLFTMNGGETTSMDD